MDILTNKRVCMINVLLSDGRSRPTIMRFILHALSALSEALTPLKHTGPWETLFPILLLESVVNFSGWDVFSNEEFDHNALFHTPRYLLFAHDDLQQTSRQLLPVSLALKVWI